MARRRLGTDEPFPGTDELFLGTDDPFLGTDELFRGTDDPFPGTDDLFPGTDDLFPGTDEVFLGTDDPFLGPDGPFQGKIASQIAYFLNFDGVPDRRIAYPACLHNLANWSRWLAFPVWKVSFVRGKLLVYALHRDLPCTFITP